MIQGVSLDAGGTLIHPWPSVGHVYAAEAERHGWPGLDPASINHKFKQAWSRRNDQFHHTREEWAAMVDATFEDVIPEKPSNSFFPVLYERFLQPDVWRIFPDVMPVLNGLREKGIPVVVTSNWDTRLRPLLESIGLARHFKDVLISLELGSTKPDGRIFAAAATSLRLCPAEILHVGDDPQADTAGALAAGFQARTVDRNGNNTSGKHTIPSLEDILQLLH
jgi:putative hydrolase of the HAD superfamily